MFFLLCRWPAAAALRAAPPIRTSATSMLARKRQALAAQQVGRDISSCLSNRYLSACDLCSALGHLFSAVAQGQIKPKTATTLAYLGQTLAQSTHVAQHEYINAFDSDGWRDAIRASFAPPSSDDESDNDADPDEDADSDSDSDSDADLESEAESGFVPSAGIPSE